MRASWDPPDYYPLPWGYDVRILRHSGTDGTPWSQVGAVVPIGEATSFAWTVQRGFWYVIQARAVNEVGPGPWCDGSPVWVP